MSSPPTVTANGTSIPAFCTLSYTYTAHPEVWRLFGGTAVNAGGLRRVRSATIAASGGNLGSNNGAEGVVWRLEGIVNAAKVAFRVGPTSAKYRFIVDGQYVDTTGIQTLATTGNTEEYITLDFTSVGGKTPRLIACEGQLTGGLEGAYVNSAAADTITLSPVAGLLRGIAVGDSYVQGSGATARGDGWASYMMDCLGIRDAWLSGSGGTGWDAPTDASAYRFGERTTDWLNFAPDVLFFHGSYNDRNATAANITANALAALRATRASLPKVPIFVFGAFAGASGPSAGILAAEAALKAAVQGFSDRYTRFIPISNDPTGAWISGTGYIGATTGVGNSDIYTSADAVHPPDVGHAYIGGLAADRVIAHLARM